MDPRSKERRLVLYEFTRESTRFWNLAVRLTDTAPNERRDRGNDDDPFVCGLTRVNAGFPDADMYRDR